MLSERMWLYINCADYILEQLSSLEVEATDRSRFQQYRDLLSLFEEEDFPMFYPEYQRMFGQALRDIAEVHLILRKFFSDFSPITPQQFGDLKLISRGKPLAEKDAPDRSYRDKQFEYFIAALFKDEGLNVQLREPDIWCSIGELKFAIAVKRIKSDQQLGKHIRKARTQIQSQPRIGVIWIGIEQILNPEFEPFYCMDNHEIEQLGNTKLAEFYKHHASEFEQAGPEVPLIVSSFWSWHLPEEVRPWFERWEEWEPKEERLTTKHSWRFQNIRYQWEEDEPEEYDYIRGIVNDVLDKSSYLHNLKLRNP